AAAGIEDGFVTSKLESIQDVGAPRGVWLRNAVVGARIPVAVGAKRHHARLTDMAVANASGPAPRPLRKRLGADRSALCPDVFRHSQLAPGYSCSRPGARQVKAHFRADYSQGSP